MRGGAWTPWERASATAQSKGRGLGMAQGRNLKKLDLVRERGGVTACKGLTELVETAEEVSSSKGQWNYQSGKEERGHKGETWVQRNELDPGITRMWRRPVERRGPGVAPGRSGGGSRQKAEAGPS